MEVLKEEILEGNLPGGLEMTQQELAESLGVSRMPVREALLILEYQGLVERLPNNHVRVTEFTDDFFREIFTLCAELENKILEQEGEFHLEEARSRFGEAVSEELQIHRQISRMAANGFLRKILETMTDIYIDFAVRRGAGSRENRTALLKEAVSLRSSEREEALKEYFRILKEELQKERKETC